MTQRVLSAVICFIMSTTFVFGKQVEVDNYSKIGKFLSIETDNDRMCSAINNSRFSRKLDRKIRKAKRKNRSSYKVKRKLNRKLNRIAKKQVRRSKRILKNERRFTKHFNLVAKYDQSVSREEVREKLITQSSYEFHNQVKSNVINLFDQSGSEYQFLINIKEKLSSCDLSFLNGETGYLILLIIFLGLPILGIITTLFALIFTLWSLALWIFVGSVTLLLIFFIWSNVSKDNLDSFEELLQKMRKQHP